ncbi:MAG: hypothetical protein ACD_39C02121G0002 [uncultured bacterium]|nr:MAG: hypothetical protein ACD_39C02121G0002 [uncultured bacterium]
MFVMTIKSGQDKQKIYEESIRKRVQPVFWSMISASTRIIQGDLLAHGINKKSFHNHRLSIARGTIFGPTLPELCAYWLAKDEILRFRAIVFPIKRTKYQHKCDRRLLTTERLHPCESIRRGILTLLGWNSAGVKTKTIWSVSPHHDNTLVINSAKEMALGIAAPSWLAEKGDIPRSITKQLLTTLQRTDSKAFFEDGHSLSSFKSSEDRKLGWLLQSCFSYIAFCANPILAKYDKKLIALFEAPEQNTFREQSKSWISEFADCLNIVLAQAERLLLFREGSLRRISEENVKGFDLSNLAYEELYPELLQTQKLEMMMPGENFSDWKF